MITPKEITQHYIKTGELNISITKFIKEDTKKMASLREEAQAHKSKQTLNIADLNRVDLSFPIEDREGTNSDGEKFEYKVMVVNDQEYRTPATVLEEIQKILKMKPDTKAVKVNKTGSGLTTKYSVDFLE